MELTPTHPDIFFDQIRSKGGLLVFTKKDQLDKIKKIKSNPITDNAEYINLGDEVLVYITKDQINDLVNKDG